jgi:hypothetical protein
MLASRKDLPSVIDSKSYIQLHQLLKKRYVLHIQPFMRHLSLIRQLCIIKDVQNMIIITMIDSYNEDYMSSQGMGIKNAVALGKIIEVVARESTLRFLL